MEEVRYYVPTRGRVDEQRTVSAFPASLRSSLTIVCPAEEVNQHERNWPEVRVVAQPSTVTTIGHKRAWIYESLAVQDDVDMAWQLDDDLKFKVCVETDSGSFNPLYTHTLRFKSSVGREYDLLHHLNGLHEYYINNDVEVLGLGTSYMAPKGGYRKDYHLGFAFGFSRVARSVLQMNRMDVFEDIDYTLQMLRQGIPIVVSYDVVVDQHKANAPGGVSDQRTLEVIERDFARLQALHPQYVTRKPLKEGAHPAAITRVSWAKAAKDGKILPYDRSAK